MSIMTECWTDSWYSRCACISIKDTQIRKTVYFYEQSIVLISYPNYNRFWVYNTQIYISSLKKSEYQALTQASVSLPPSL